LFNKSFIFGQTNFDMKKIFLVGIVAVGALTMTACKKKGCIDNTATNYNSKAKKDDGTCLYVPTIQIIGATDTTISVGNTYTDPGATAKNRDESVVEVTATNNVNDGTTGVYTVDYSATNDNGTATAQRTVRVAIRQDSYIKTWSVSPNCGTKFPLASAPSVTAGSQENSLVVDGMFTLLGGTANATVNGANIVFPQQSIAVTGGEIQFTGTGAMISTGNIINVTYNYVNTIPVLGGSGTCTATYTKQ
jgi:hypothetical protein